MIVHNLADPSQVTVAAIASLTVARTGRYNLGLSSERFFWRFVTVAYAIIQSGGKQFRVAQGEVVRLPSIAAQVGDSVELDVLAKGDAQSIDIGSPIVDGARVTAKVIEHGRGQKVIVFKKKRRKQYKKKHGHRQDFTAVQIESITTSTKESS
jgi:large subunit ribosomal protein L21